MKTIVEWRGQILSQLARYCASEYALKELKNKYGLSRYVPSGIRSKIRSDAGFGCVLCGCVLVDYEHIEPEFHQAKEHNPDKMTLLCIMCHGRVTKKLISKNAVWEAKSNPKALQDGYVHDLLFVNTDEMEIRAGSCTFRNTRTFLIICGKPIIWFEPPLIAGEPSKLCAIFYDREGRITSYVNRNQFVAYSSNQDVQSQSTTISIRSNGINCLNINREGDKALHISGLQARYLGASVSIDSQGELILDQGGSSLTLSGAHVENCGVACYLGNSPAVQKYKKLSLALTLAHSPVTKSILNLKGEMVGWALGGEIFNLHYELVGIVRGCEVLSLNEEYIGELIGSYVAYDDDCYESGEPIFITKENREFKKRNPNIGFDLSFRLFGYIA